MAADGADARAGLADVAAKKQQVAEHLDVVDAGHMLGQPHAVDRDYPLRRAIAFRHVAERLAAEAADGLDLVPGRRAAVRGEGRKAGRMLGDEGMIEHAAIQAVGGGRLDGIAGVVVRGAEQRLAVLDLCFPGRERGVVGLDQRLADPGQRGDVATDLHLVDLIGDLGLPPQHHLLGRLRVAESLQSALAQRIEADDLHATARGVLQLMQDARRRGPRVVRQVENEVGLIEVLQRDRAHGNADALRQRHRRGFVAHVGAVRQVVGAIEPREELPEIAGLEGGAAARIEDRLVRITAQRRQFTADVPERVLPGDRHVFVALRVPTHRTGEPSGLFEVVIEPAFKLGQGVPGEERFVAAFAGQFPGGRLGAVLTELGDLGPGGLGPGAADAHRPAGLVLMTKRIDRAGRQALADQYFAHRRQRAIAARRAVIGLYDGLGFGAAVHWRISS